RLAEHEFQPAAKLSRHAVDVGPQVVETYRLVARRSPDAGGRAVLAEAFAERKAPFAGGDAGFGAVDRGGHDVSIFSGRGAQLFESRRDRLLLAGAAPCLEAFDLLGFRLRRDRDDSVGRARERRRLALHEPIDPDHRLLAAFDRLDAAGVRFHELMFHIALLHGGGRASPRTAMRPLPPP